MHFISSALLACVATATAAGLDSPLTTRQGCAKGYELCAADGATGGLPPSMGDGLVELYTDLVNSINAAKEKRSSVVQKLHGQKNVKRNDDDSDDDDDEDDDDEDDDDFVPDLCCKGEQSNAEVKTAADFDSRRGNAMPTARGRSHLLLLGKLVVPGRRVRPY